MEHQVWYITGASVGLGLELAKFLLEKGDKVSATSHKLANLESKLYKENKNFLLFQLNFDKAINAQIAQNLAAVQKKFDRLDNVVNNADYRLLGLCRRNQ